MESEERNKSDQQAWFRGAEEGKREGQGKREAKR